MSTEAPSSKPGKQRKVVYVYDDLLAQCTDKIPHIRERGRMVDELIRSYNLTNLMECQPSRIASEEDLLKFHSPDYVNFLLRKGDASVDVDTEDEDDEDEDNTNGTLENNEVCVNGGSDYKIGNGISNGNVSEDNLDEFGLGYDCPLFKGLGQFALRIAGGTITAADALVNGTDVAINWGGGWHHAQRSEASGFCYVNDIVLGIHHLQKRFRNILYLDLDAHHGDGVQNAFAFSNKVMTLSFHHFESGYFPGTGSVTDVGQGRGRFYSLNVPLKMGVTDSQYIFLFDSIFQSVVRNFQPDAFVVQCGADCLANDPLGAFNLTLKSINQCVDKVLTVAKNENSAVLLLGGGGYNTANTARLWTSLTATALGVELSKDIPDNKYFLKYGSDFELSTSMSLRKNENDQEYISEIIDTIMGHLISLRKRKGLF